MSQTSSELEKVLASLTQHSAGEVVESLRQRGPIGTMLTKLAEECEKAAISDLSRALSLTQALVGICDAADECRARARRARAQALAYSNQFAQAQEVLSEGIHLAEKAGELTEAAQCRLMSLHALARQGRFDEAIAIGEAAREAFVRAGETLHAARADINVGVTLRMKDDPAAAIERFDRARAGVLHVPMILAQMQSNRAEALLDLHRFDEAREAFTESLAAFERAGVQRAAAIVEGNLADLCGRQGRLDEALEHFERARRRFGEVDSPGDAARLEVERAEALLQLGAIKEAETAVASALSELEPRGMVMETARARAALGKSLLAQHRYTEAMVELGAARSGFDSVRHPTGTIRVRLLLARALNGAGDLNGALKTLDELVGTAGLRPIDQVEISALRAMTKSRLGLTSEAVAEITSAVSAARDIGLPVLSAELLQQQAWIQENNREFAAALNSLRLAMDAVERVRSGLRGEQYRAVFSGAFSGVYDEFTRLWLDQGGDATHALEVIERGRSRALLDTVDAGASFSELASLSSDDAELLKRRQLLHTRLSALHHSIERGAGRAAAQAGIHETESLERELRDVEFRLAATRRFAGDFAPPPSARQVLDAIPSNGTLIEYFWDGLNISACVVSKGACRVFRTMCSQDSVREALGSLRLQIAMAASRGFPSGERGAQMAERAKAQLARLGSLLLVPLGDSIQDSTEIAIIADDFLGSVPFQCLMVGGKSMLDIADVVTAPSAAVLSELSRRPRQQGKSVVIGVADENAPQAEVESSTIANTIGADQVLLGASATIDRVKIALQGASIVHIASHARFVAESPMQSALKMSDGWLSARDLYGIELAGGTVVLSGCNSGKTGVSHGRELLGLVRAFMTAGARSLVLSHWILHDTTASTLLVELYKVWYAKSSGAGGPQSPLRQAQVQVRALMPHVAAWGPLHVVGGWSGGNA